MRARLRPTAILWGIGVQFVLGLGCSALVLGGSMAAGYSMEAQEELLADGGWLVGWSVVTVFIGVVAGAVTGVKAGRLEAVHAALLIAVLWLVDLGLATLAEGLPTGDELAAAPWQSHLGILGTLLGGLLVQLRRVRRENRQRSEGDWWCEQCGFQGTPSDVQCARCGSHR
jgi:hypothetical protein